MLYGRYDDSVMIFSGPFILVVFILLPLRPQKKKLLRVTIFIPIRMIMHFLRFSEVFPYKPRLLARRTLMFMFSCGSIRFPREWAKRFSTSTPGSSPVFPDAPFRIPSYYISFGSNRLTPCDWAMFNCRSILYT